MLKASLSKDAPVYSGLPAATESRSLLGRRTVFLSRAAAFTLVELLAAMVIILVLAGLTLGIARYTSTRSGVSRAKAEIAAMEAALESYKSDTGTYPSSGIANVYTALAGSSKKYMSFSKVQLSGTTIIDPFGIAYNYLQPGTKNPGTFDLWSNGPNRGTGTPANSADDIGNWQ